MLENLSIQSNARITTSIFKGIIKTTINKNEIETNRNRYWVHIPTVLLYLQKLSVTKLSIPSA